MIDIEFDGSKAVAKLESYPDRVKAELVVGVGRITKKLVRLIVQNKLAGQVLKVRTGRLRRGVGDDVQAQGNSVVGVVSDPVEYAARHEYGFTGTENVREHLRRSRAQFSLRKVGKGGFETKGSRSKWSGKGDILVRAHTRHVDYPPHSFLRTGLADLMAQGVLEEEIDAALRRALK